MDSRLAPETEESYTLTTISRAGEIKEWLSSKVRMRITRTITGGFGTVYCVIIVFDVADV